MRASTILMIKKHGWRIDRLLHNYIYFVFYYPYVKAALWIVRSLKYLQWCKPLAVFGRMVFNRYHAKILSYEDTQKIFSLNEDLRFVSQENKRIIPYKYATKIIFQEPDYIVVMDCPCKLATHAPAEDINSCIAVGRGVSSFWLEHCGKYHPRRISPEEAIAIIQRFRKKQHITQAFFKVATGGCTGIICNCHPETCVSLKATQALSKIDNRLSMSAESGYSVRCDEKKCNACGGCEKVCHFGAISFIEGRWSYHRRACVGCGLCVESCPEEALSLYVDSEKSLPLDLDRIKADALAAGGAGK
jgi:ferredoxin